MRLSDRTRQEAGAPDATREIEQARDCHRRRAWSDAFRAFSRAEASGSLSPPDLERFATVAYLIGRDDDYRKALERAHLAYLDAGCRLASTRCAFWLGYRQWFRGETGQATGWFGLAQRLAEGEAESVEHGLLLVAAAEQQLAAGDSESAFATGERAAEIGGRHEDADLVAMARHQQGRARLQQQQLPAGLALLDETMVLVMSGRLSPVVTGLMFCSVVQRCQAVYALGRAREWAAALATWCDEQPEMVAFSGVCRVHRAEILQLRGAWTEAMAEAERACERTIDRQAAGAAFYQLGEVHRLRGDAARAEQAYRTASERGLEPQPGLALLRLAQGHPDAALAAIRRAAKVTTEPWQLVRLLPACVEIFLASGELLEARSACGELERIARAVDTEVLAALAAQARGALDLAEGHPETSLSPLRASRQVWEKIEAPYLVAGVRVLIGLAYRRLGDEEGGQLELDAARATYQELGAISDLRRLDALTRPAARPHGLSARELEVLRLIARGLTNKTMAGTLFVSERTIDRHVSNIFTKLGVSSRAAATAFAYEHGLLSRR
jgi:DNA-binding CsgD family transcriptional regulator